MGCDIHILMEINKDGKWKHIDDVPSTFDTRNYSTFAVLADVRNSFSAKHFPLRGLPEDISRTKFYFESEIDEIRKRYLDGGHEFCKLPDGQLISLYDDLLKMEILEEEKNQYSNWHSEGERLYIYDISKVNGERVFVPYTETYPTLQSFIEDNYKNDWDEESQDYGYWRYDFNCVDYHSHNYITLEEFLNFDYSDYRANKCKVSKSFYDTFIEKGGQLPEGMYIIDEEPSEFRSRMNYAFDPYVLICWQDSEDTWKETPMYKGIEEIKDIANQYNITDYSKIRMIFAFDN